MAWASVLIHGLLDSRLDNVVDDFTRKCEAIEFDTSLFGESAFRKLIQWGRRI